MKKLSAFFFPEIAAVPAVFQANYFNSLDGFRAISILIVIAGHYNFRWGVATLDKFIDHGILGVFIFFVISGFLITTLLLKEKISTGNISLREFYLRRLFRIVPVAYLYLAVVLALNYFYDLGIPAFAFLSAALFLRNFAFTGEGSWYVNHYWSLAVEEQYYLIFPAILKWGFRYYFLIITALISMTVAFSFLQGQIDFFKRQRLFYEFFGQGLQGILIGSFFSFLVFQDRINWAFFKRFRTALNIALVLLIIAVHNNLFNAMVAHVIPSFLTGVLLYAFVSLLIINNLMPGTDIFYRLLNSKLMIRIGMLSYGLYIWQQLFTVSTKVEGASELPWYSFPINMILLVGITILCFNYFEKPLRNLRKRIVRR